MTSVYENYDTPCELEYDESEQGLDQFGKEPEVIWFRITIEAGLSQTETHGARSS